MERTAWTSHGRSRFGTRANVRQGYPFNAIDGAEPLIIFSNGAPLHAGAGHLNDLTCPIQPNSSFEFPSSAGCWTGVDFDALPLHDRSSGPVR